MNNRHGVAVRTRRAAQHMWGGKVGGREIERRHGRRTSQKVQVVPPFASALHISNADKTHYVR